MEDRAARRLLTTSSMARNPVIRRGRRGAAGHAALIALSCVAACGPRPGPPAADSCDGPRADGISTLSVGPSSGFGDYHAWIDGDVPSTTSGGQGAPMLVLRIAVAGATPPSCLQQSTAVEVAPFAGAAFELAGRDATPRKTYAQPDGSRLTDNIYVVLDFLGASLKVTTTVGAATVTRVLGVTPPDMSAGVDLGAFDAGHD